MLVLQAVVAFALAANPESSYAWPLDLPKIVTGTFGEYRGGRFHAGVDLHTGDIGKPVHAPADGHVARVSCSPWGYGKAVYLKLDDGNTVVFGHLSRFADSLNGYVRKTQHAKETYSVDLEPDPAMFRVTRGEIVAFSGDTGIGDAHLHYEIRNVQGCPINPRILGITWPDTTPPVFHRLLVAPADPDSTVNGDILPSVINVRAAGPNRYVCDPVHASGRIGFGLDVIDPANEGSSRLGVYSLRASIRGEEIFQIKMNRFSYEDRENEIVSYYPFLIDQGCFLLQWRWPGNVCDIFNQTRADGWCEVPSEPAEVQIEAADFDGNKAAMVVPLQPEKRTEAPDSSHGAGTGTGTVEVSCVDTWLAVTAKFSAPEPQIPGLSVEGPVAAAGGFFHRVNATTFRAGVLPAREAEEITLRVKHDRIKPFDQRIYVFQRGSPDRTIAIDDAKITVKSNSPYGTLFLRGRTMEKASGCPVPQRGKALWLWPADLPIDVPISITLPAPGGIQDPRRAAVYRDAGSWWRLESETGKDPFTISTRHLGAFAVLEDTQPPSITNILAGNAAMRPTIRATVGDAGSGVADVAVTCNGHWLLAAYDPEKNVIAWEKDEDLPEGAKELKFTVTDKAGNSTTVMRAIEPGKEKAPTAKPKAAKPKATTSKSAAHKGAPQKVRTK